MALSLRDLVSAAETQVSGTRAVLGGRDLAAAAATLTFFSGIAVVPWLLLSVWTTTWGRGADGAERRMLALRVLVPPDMGARPAYDALVGAGAHAGLLTAVVLLFPASFYGEGLRRACLVLAPHPETFTGWRARLAMILLVLPLPALAWAMLTVGDRLVPLAPEGGGGGAGDLLVRVLVGFTALWLVLSVLLTWVFIAVAPHRPRGWVAVVGALGTGSFLAGFLHGFQLFLSLPVDVGLPFAGLGVVGGVVAVGLWLYVLHTFLLLGWAATQALEAQVADRASGGGRVSGASVVELRVWGVGGVLPALGRMAAGRAALRRTPGLRFAKLLGTGSGRTFTPRDADPHHWALLTVWDDHAAADVAAGTPLVRAWERAAHETLVVRMQPLVARGRWSGVEPFRAVARPAYAGPVAAITRARLRTSRTLSFWRAVPPWSRTWPAPRARVAIGVGEAPVGLQGTFSLWSSSAALTDFAYRGAAHREVVEQTRSQRWYAEELFARLAVLDVDGTYQGRTP